ncbi:MAG: chromosomal replication initiator protein DnaA [Sphaerochaetaceae bacterium]|nr:chromosomal replication initiator protein DnaA [Sphaerochaetaceae bacterium]MDC7236478.1 chromosomal replication initiator protein DnaA [Sphaerochaetaceae bacterium]
MVNTQEFYSDLWDKILDRLIQNNKSAENSKMEFVYAEDGKLYIDSVSEFRKGYYTNQYLKLLNEYLSDLSDEKLEIVFFVNDKKDNKTISKTVEKKVSSTITKINNREEKKDNDFSSLISSKKNSFQAKKIETRRLESNLNERYTFDSFIMGDNTSLAYNVSYAISKEPGIAYNPCLIYGGVGLGKTHLLQSIGNSILENNDRLKVIYVTAEKFTNEFINALGTNSQINNFKNKYRKVDVLLIDDVHFLQKKQGIQEELFHTFNDLYETRRQMVFTCDRPINELKSMTDRLKSRFSRGINVDLRPPEYETKVKIIRVKNKEKNYILNDEIVDYLCQNINTNVRDLEAAFTKLSAFHEFTNIQLTLDKAKELIAPTLSSENNALKNLSVDKIIRATAEYFDLTSYDLKGKKRNRKIVNARQIAIFLSRELTDFSTTEIGYDFSKDHTTIMHAIEKVEKAKSSNIELNKNLESIKNSLLSLS